MAASSNYQLSEETAAHDLHTKNEEDNIIARQHRLMYGESIAESRRSKKEKIAEKIQNLPGGGPDLATMKEVIKPIKNMKPSEVSNVLKEYQNKFQGNNNKAIVSTNTQGKPSTPLKPFTSHHDQDPQPTYPTIWELIRDCHLKPKSGLAFSVEDPTLDEVMPCLMNNTGIGFFTDKEIANLASLDTEYHRFVNLCGRLRNVDFSSLKNNRLNYEEQEEISTERVEEASACLLHYGGDPSMLTRFCNGEYTGARRDIDKILKDIRDHVDQKDYNDVERILREGCPDKFNRTVTHAEKMKYLKRGNCPSVIANSEKVIKAMNKEDRYNHVIPVDQGFCRFSAFIHHVPQTMNTKKENIRLCWNGSKKYGPDDKPMNEDVDMEDAPLITFGNTNEKFMREVYNLRIDHPEEEIWLGTIDLSACFRHSRINPSAVGGFSFVFGFMNILFIMTAMVFGFALSANYWEPFRRCTEEMTKVFYTKYTDDESVHQEYIDMVQFEKLPPKGTKFTPAYPCSKNRGCIDEKGSKRPMGSFIYVDDALLAAVWHKMSRLLRATISAIFTVCGEPDTKYRRCPMSLDKWVGQVIGPNNTLLGFMYDTRLLVTGMTKAYIAELHHILKTTWHSKRKRFTVSELQKMLGKAARIGMSCNWVYNLLTHLYSSTAFALKGNEEFLATTSNNFRNHLKKIKELKKREAVESSMQNIAHINFAVKKTAKMIHGCDKQYPITKDMRAEIDFMMEATKPESKIEFICPIAHQIPRDPSGEAASDSCEKGGGGFSVNMSFIWFLLWNPEIRLRTREYIKDKGDKRLISINVLEFYSVIVNYCAALVSLEELNWTDDPWPVILTWCDNTSAVSWVTHGCLRSAAGRALGRFFCGLLIGSRLGINSTWLSTLDNVIADDVSRLEVDPTETNTISHDHNVDFSSILQKYPQLSTCRRFVPSSELISMLDDCVLKGSCPSLEQIQKLKQNGLGRLISLDG